MTPHEIKIKLKTILSDAEIDQVLYKQFFNNTFVIDKSKGANQIHFIYDDVRSFGDFEFLMTYGHAVGDRYR